MPDNSNFLPPIGHGERIAVLEDWRRRHDIAFAEHARSVNAKLDQILETQIKQKGMVGGISLVFTGVVAVLMLFREWIAVHLK